MLHIAYRMPHAALYMHVVCLVHCQQTPYSCVYRPVGRASTGPRCCQSINAVPRGDAAELRYILVTIGRGEGMDTQTGYEDYFIRVRTRHIRDMYYLGLGILLGACQQLPNNYGAPC